MEMIYRRGKSTVSSLPFDNEKSMVHGKSPKTESGTDAVDHYVMGSGNNENKSRDTNNKTWFSGVPVFIG